MDTDNLGYEAFMEVAGLSPESYQYLYYLYSERPSWKNREFHYVKVNGNYYYGLRSPDIEKYLIKQEVRSFWK